MIISMFRSLVIDRIRFFVNVPSSDLYSHVWSQLFEIKAMGKQLLPGGRITAKKLKHGKTRLRYCPKARRCIASIEVGIAADKKKYFSLDLFPTRFRGSEFSVFKELLANLLDDFNYTKLFHTAKVSYLELAADSLLNPMGSFLPFRTKTASSHVHPLPDGTGSINLGALSGRLRFSIYDKKRHIVEKWKELPLHQLQTRIEARIRTTGLTANKLEGCLKNPLPKLEIADLKELQKSSPSPAFTAFLVQCSKVGACAALKSLSLKERRKYILQLRKAKVTWWKPQAIWQYLPSALKVIAP